MQNSTPILKGVKSVKGLMPFYYSTDNKKSQSEKNNDVLDNCVNLT